jgi:hypothetical protein
MAKGKIKSSFSGVITLFSALFLKMLQDEAPILQFLLAARLLMSISFAKNSDSLCEVLWADDKSKPYKNI